MAMKRGNLPAIVPELFEHEQFGQFRFIKHGEEIWFVANDLCRALGYSNPRDALSKHVYKEDKRVILKSQIATLDTTLEIPNRGLTFINESGMYCLIFGSNLPAAKRFTRWVTNEVLPSIRETGSYSLPTKKKKELPPLPPGLLNDDPTDFGNVVRFCKFLEEHGIEYDYELKPEIIQDENGEPTVCYSFDLVIKDE